MRGGGARGGDAAAVELVGSEARVVSPAASPARPAGQVAVRAAAVAAGSAVAAGALAAVVRGGGGLLGGRGRRRGGRRRGRRREGVVATRSFLIDVHLLERR